MSIQFAYESSRHCLSIGQLAMRYERVIVTRYGGPEVISLIEEDLPAPSQRRSGEGLGCGR